MAWKKGFQGNQEPRKEFNRHRSCQGHERELKASDQGRSRA